MSNSQHYRHLFIEYLNNCENSNNFSLKFKYARLLKTTTYSSILKK